MPKKEGMMGCCMHKGKGVAIIVLGLLILGNFYWSVVDWVVFWGWILVIAGLLKMVMPHKHMMMR